uniref:ATP synthase complex subunit 8 n=1 Tax=Sphenophryne schlaginhaufeni TaxID=480199 RepID=A0A343VT75_9NEOB|nr:ATP synthase subunit 8 [Sphenophryne schlaginhaufeni]
MPQLIPAPWFLIFISFWFILITLSPLKILPHTLLNNPLTKTSKTQHQTWPWPWL